ncbi:hypothetical protein [uncultured Desulfobacter sp.]|uniref:hypothetical protein n=1 Tax=uncultured Desulfobacter sp. TaxID=240139 RepID=UPI002AA8A40C|nr:hypothetical protein [uncultured Desulfobacter sp.]
MNKKKIFKEITALAAAFLLIGCAGAPKPKPAQTALAKWGSRPINADGSKKDWPKSTPQYTNRETDTQIWIRNNADHLFLLAEVKDPQIAQQLTQGGLILSMKTKEKGAKPFSIKLKGHPPFKSRDKQPDPMRGVKLPDTLTVTYPFSSGPITMSMKEARITGIAIGLADSGRHTLIFEAAITLNAIFFDVPRIAGTKINIALSAKNRVFPMKQRGNPGADKGNPPKEGPHSGGYPDKGSSGANQGPGKTDDIKRPNLSNESFRADIEITLAEPSK